MIRTVIFDLGGVVMTLNPGEAMRRFKQLGLENAEEILDVYTQGGIFGQLEDGSLSSEDYIEELGKIVGRKLSWEEVKNCWTGYVEEVPERNLQLINNLRDNGYRVILLSNTNAFMQEWAESGEFDGKGHGIQTYFDAMYRSYEVKYMKPDERFFRHVLLAEDLLPEEALFVDDGPRNVAAASELGIQTFCPKNGEDWTEELLSILKSR